MAKAIADAFSDTKLIMKPLITGAINLQIKSIRLIIEFIFVKTSKAWPSDITTTLFFENNHTKIRVVENFKLSFFCLICQDYHSLSIRMVPARVESAPTAPEMSVSNNSKMNAPKFVDFKVEKTSKAITETPAMIKERFWDTNQILRAC